MPSHQHWLQLTERLVWLGADVAPASSERRTTGRLGIVLVATAAAVVLLNAWWPSSVGHRLAAPSKQASRFGPDATSSTSVPSFGAKSPNSPSPTTIARTVGWTRTPSSAIRSDVLAGISCPTRTECVEAGGPDIAWSSASTGDLPGKWHTYPLPAGLVASGPIDCPSSHLCLTTGANPAHPGAVLLVTTDPDGGTSAWTLVTLSYLDHAAQPHGISCPSATFCIVASRDGTIFSSLDPATTSSWQMDGVTSRVELLGISCPTTTFCAAVGNAIPLDQAAYVFTSTNPAAGSSARWSEALIAHNARATTTGGGGTYNNDVQSITCPTARFCLMTDNNDDVIWSTDPAAGSHAWSTQPLSPLKVGTASCTTASFCVMTGQPVIESTHPAGGRSSWSAADGRSGSPGDATIWCLTSQVCRGDAWSLDGS